MTLTQIAIGVGDENVEVQALHESFVSARVNGQGATIAFATHPHKVRDLDRDKPDFVCLILWLPRNKIPAEPTHAPAKCNQCAAMYMAPTTGTTFGNCFCGGTLEASKQPILSTAENAESTKR